MSRSTTSKTRHRQSHAGTGQNARSDGFIVQGMSASRQIEGMFDRVAEFGSLDVFVANARTDIGTFHDRRCPSASSN